VLDFKPLPFPFVFFFFFFEITKKNPF